MVNGCLQEEKIAQQGYGTSGRLREALSMEACHMNVTSVGFQEDGKWMFTGGEDCTARIWNLR